MWKRLPNVFKLEVVVVIEVGLLEKESISIAAVVAMIPVDVSRAKLKNRKNVGVSSL